MPACSTYVYVCVLGASARLVACASLMRCRLGLEDQASISGCLKNTVSTSAHDCACIYTYPNNTHVGLCKQYLYEPQPPILMDIIPLFLLSDSNR